MPKFVSYSVASRQQPKKAESGEMPVGHRAALVNLFQCAGFTTNSYESQRRSVSLWHPDGPVISTGSIRSVISRMPVPQRVEVPWSQYSLVLAAGWGDDRRRVKTDVRRSVVIRSSVPHAHSESAATHNNAHACFPVCFSLLRRPKQNHSKLNCSYQRQGQHGPFHFRVPPKAALTELGFIFQPLQHFCSGRLSVIAI